MAAQALLDILAAYGAVGVAFAIAFVTAGIARLDPVAQEAPLGFRLMVLSGSAALWPLLLARWIRAVSRGGRP
jgi:hypothetical protein